MPLVSECKRLDQLLEIGERLNAGQVCSPARRR
jgi:hypothetical protein